MTRMIAACLAVGLWAPGLIAEDSVPVAPSIPTSPTDSAAPPPPPLTDQSTDANFLAQKLADRYGFQAWPEIQIITFTFNVQLPGRDQLIARSWEWDVEAGLVTRMLDGEIHRINLRDLTATAPDTPPTTVLDTQVHSQFVNDAYWLLFPFQLIWSNPQVTVSEQPQLMPMTNDTAYRYTAQWPAEGGYTPGDAYDLYVDADTGLIQQWAFRKGGTYDNPRPATWDDHQQLGPIVVCLDHHGPKDDADNQAETFRLWFTDVTATLHGGTLVRPEPLHQP